MKGEYRYSVRRASAEFRKSAETITRGLRRDGKEVKAGNTYSAYEIMQAISSDAAEARAREQLASAQLKEFELAERKGELFNRDAVVREIGKVGVWIRNKVMEMPHLLAALVNPSDPVLSREQLIRYGDDMLKELSALVPELDVEKTEDQDAK